MSRGRDDGNDTWKRLSTFFHVSAAESTSSLTTAVEMVAGAVEVAVMAVVVVVVVAVMAMMVVMAMVDGCGGSRDDGCGGSRDDGCGSSRGGWQWRWRLWHHCSHFGATVEKPFIV